MNSTAKNALKGGAVVGGGLLLVGTIIGIIVLPAAIAAAWYFGVWSFEAAVIALLLIACYSGASGGGE